MSAWIGAALGGVGSLLGTIGQSKIIEEQLWAQQEENRKNREYNLMLAQQQNKWSVEQWERENEYNSPTNQMARLKNAGINPNLAYSNGVHNISASSPSMTAGAPSTAADMSALGQKPTLGQAMQMALNMEASRAQIENINANTRKTLADAGITEVEERAIKAIEQINGVSIDSATLPPNWKYNPIISARLAQFEKAVTDAKSSAHLANINGYKEFEAQIDKEFKREKVQYEVQLLAKALDIRTDEAEFISKSLASRIKGVHLDVKSKEYEALLNSPKLIEKLPEGIKPLISLLNLIFRGH